MSNMYDIDPELAAGYKAEKVNKQLRTPRLPKVEVEYNALLCGVEKDNTPKAGKQYVFKFRVTKSNTELVQADTIYEVRFYQGNGSEVDTEKFWNKITPMLLAVFGQTNALKFPAPDKLGELVALTRDAGTSLDMAFRGSRVLADARPDAKTGKFRSDDLEEDGVTPKKFARDNFAPASI